MNRASCFETVGWAIGALPFLCMIVILPASHCMGLMLGSPTENTTDSSGPCMRTQVGRAGCSAVA